MNKEDLKFISQDNNKVYDDSKSIKFVSHPSFSIIHLQGIAEYFMPDASSEKINEFIQVIQNLNLTSKSE